MQIFLISNHNYAQILEAIPRLFGFNVRKIYLRDSSLDSRVFSEFLKLESRGIEIFINAANLKRFTHNKIHLKSHELPLVCEIRAANPKAIFSYAAHNLNEILRAHEENIDFIFISPIFAVENKNAPLGLEFLEQIPREIRHKIFALGGVNLKNMSAFSRFEIAGIAGIRILSDIENTAAKILNNA